MRKSLKWLAALLIPLGLLAAIVTLVWHPPSIEAQLTAQIMRLTGLQAVARGPAHFRLLPRPQIVVEHISIADSAGSVRIAAGGLTLRGNLRLLALLAGNIEFDRIELIKPDIIVDLDRDTAKGADWLRQMAEPAGATAKEADGEPVGLFILTGATVRLTSARRALDMQFEDVHLRFDWPRVGSPLAINGRGRWHDARFNLAAWLGAPAALVRGDQSALTLNLRGTEGRLALRGTLQGGNEARFEGNAQAEMPALSHFLHLAGLDASLKPADERFAASGNVAAGLRDIAVSGLHLSVLGSDFDGAVTLRDNKDGRALSGTLASDLLKLSPLLTLARQLTGPDGQWRSGPQDLAFQPGIDLDVRISAAKLVTGTARAEDAALAVRGQGGKLAFELVEARIFGGTVKAHAAVSRAGDGLVASLDGEGAGLDLAQICEATQCARRLTGRADLSFALAGRGHSPKGLLQNVAGRAKASLASGSFAGIDFAQALRRIEKKSWPALANLHEGISSFERCEISLVVQNGMATLENTRLTGAALRLDLSGSAALSSGQLALKGIASQTGADGAFRPDGPMLSFELAGPWYNPVFTPDLRDLVPATGE